MNAFMLTACDCPWKVAGYRFTITPSGWVRCGHCGGLRAPKAPPWRVYLEGGMVGKVYLEKGEPVTVLAQWRGKGCPRNVVVGDTRGDTKVRPSRGLKRAP